MHPKALLEACTELIGAVLKFDAPADNIVSFFLRQHRELGPRERHTLPLAPGEIGTARITLGENLLEITQSVRARRDECLADLYRFFAGRHQAADPEQRGQQTEQAGKRDQRA